METNKFIQTQIIKYFSCEDQNICRLCFACTGVTEVNFYDNVTFHRNSSDECITIVDLLMELGMQNEPSLPAALCADCATNAVNSYLFQKKCHYAHYQWSNVLGKLEQCFAYSQTLQPDIQTLYLNVEKDKHTLYTSKKKIIKNKKVILAKAKSYMKKRTLTNKKEKQTVCEECGLSFESNIKLVRHVRNAHSKFRITCQECGKLFETKSQYTDHKERIHDPKRIPCPQCNKMFSTMRLLGLHNKMHHVAAICKLCFAQLPSRNALKMHLDKHDIHKCDRCNKILINKHAFKLHNKYCGNPLMKGPQVFCDICNKGYSRKTGLLSHLKVDHGFGKVYVCMWCGKKYDAISRLNMHIVKHTRARNFHCEICGGKFVTQAALVYHTRLHTGERPFACDMCDERFLSASRRLEHKKRKHLGPSEECYICHVKFTSKFQLRKHLERHKNPSSKLYIPDIKQVLLKNSYKLDNNTLTIL